MAINPTGISFELWSSLTAPTLSASGFVPTFGTTSNWKDWAKAVKAIPSLGSVSIPSPSLYSDSDWQGWATRLYETLGKDGL